ncbi:hypothetical protein Pcinc_038810, partial [Petrolisthes cinctipes]
IKYNKYKLRGFGGSYNIHEVGHQKGVPTSGLYSRVSRKGVCICHLPGYVVDPIPSTPNNPAQHRPAQHKDSLTHNQFIQSELGGPLVMGGGTGGREVVVGVAGFSDGERQDDQQPLPLIFTNITKYIAWIIKTIGKDDRCAR